MASDTDEVTPRSILSWALVGERPYDQAQAILDKIATKGWTVAKLGLAESQARESETSLMVGRLAGLARSSGLTADQRIGVCLAQKVLEERREELRARRTPPASTTAEEA